MSALKSRAKRLSWLKSLINALPAPGYWILTATWRPSCQAARCTWPMEAAVMSGPGPLPGSRQHGGGGSCDDRGLAAAAEDQAVGGELL